MEPQGRNPLAFRKPQLPAVLAENSAETCPVDKDGKRLLPDGSAWVVRGTWHVPGQLQDPGVRAGCRGTSVRRLLDALGGMCARVRVYRLQVSLMHTINDVALASRPYRYRSSLTRRPNQQLKWLLPLVVAGQVSEGGQGGVGGPDRRRRELLTTARHVPCRRRALPQYFLFRDFIRPRMDRDLKRQQEADEHVWEVKAEQRKKLGIGPPLKPSKENAWRLEQIYEDD